MQTVNVFQSKNKQLNPFAKKGSLGKRFQIIHIQWEKRDGLGWVGCRFMVVQKGPPKVMKNIDFQY